jgi:hypothetical protein
MADEVDATDLRQEVLLAASISHISEAARKLDIHGDGNCIVCGNEVSPMAIGGKIVTGRWCSTECRDRTDL